MYQASFYRSSWRLLITLGVLASLAASIFSPSDEMLRSNAEPLQQTSGWQWYDGANQFSEVPDCNLNDVNGVGAYTGFSADLNGGQPRPDQVYYLHVVMAGLSVLCPVNLVYLEIELPRSTSFAIDSTYKLRCYHILLLEDYTLDFTDESSCPKTLAPSSQNSGAFAILSTDQENGNTWLLPYAEWYEFRIPVKSAEPLSNEIFQANLWVLDGYDSPWLRPQVGVHVFDAVEPTTPAPTDPAPTTPAPTDPPPTTAAPTDPAPTTPAPTDPPPTTAAPTDPAPTTPAPTDPPPTTAAPTDPAPTTPAPTDPPPTTAAPTDPAPTTPAPTDPPPTTAAPTDPAPTTPAPTAPGNGLPGQHIVRQGETLFCIGRGYGVLPWAIATANGISSPYLIFAGQALTIPDVPWTQIPPGPVCPRQFDGSPPPVTAAPTTPAPTTGCRYIHIVFAGDTLNKISRTYGVDVFTLASVNRIANINLIYVGQRLCIP